MKKLFTLMAIMMMAVTSAWAGTAPQELCFTAEEAGAKVSFKINGSLANNPSLQYQTVISNASDQWKDYTFGEEITLTNIDDKVYFKAGTTDGSVTSNSSFSKDDRNYIKFTSTGKVAASGNIMSLLDATCESTTIPAEYTFCYLFYGCTSLTAAPELPATELADRCYYHMFNSCTSLTAAPELPATELADMCYYHMFNSCTSLTAAPALPATTMKESCYQSMFADCTSLTAAPELPATSLAEYCYDNMFKGCTSLTAAPELPATTLAEDCYKNMFKACTSLIAAPELPATTLAESCYTSMFSGCTSLTAAPELPATSLAESCYQYMFQGCTSLTTAPELKATELANSCYSYMFYGCTSLTTAPELKATELANSCYSTMFYGCTSLTTAPAELPATTLAESCNYGMFAGCTSLTTAPELKATELANSCYSYMFYGCTGLTTAPELPATTLAEYCYANMFQGCSKLNKVAVNFTDWNTSGGATSEWLDGVAATGTFTCPEGLTIPETRSASDVPTGWTVKAIAPAVVTAIVKINAIGTVEYTEACKAKIDAARAAYDALTDAQKAQVDAADLKTLTDAEAKYAALEEANSGKFTVTTTFENADGTSKETIKAQVSKDFEVTVTLPKKDAAMYANKVTVTATMKGVEGLGMKADETRTYSKTFTSTREEKIILSDYLVNFYKFDGERDKHFTLKVGDVDPIVFTVTSGANWVKATPDNVENAHKAWAEICKRIETTTVEKEQLTFAPKIGSYLVNNDEMWKVKDSKHTFGDSKNLYKNLVSFWNVVVYYKIPATNHVEAAIAPKSSLTIGTTCVTVKDNSSISVTIDNDDHDAYVPSPFLVSIHKDVTQLLLDYPENSPELKNQFIKNVLGYIKTVDAAIVGKKNVTVTVSFDEATGISELTTHDSELQKDGKFIENGRVVIVKNGMRYNANGQRLK